MCGRYSLSVPTDVLARVFGLASVPAWKPRYNIAPSQEAPVVRGEAGARRIDLLKWGLIPNWADDPAIGNRLIMARAESALNKPAFRTAFRRRRCLIPADGFFEWLKSGSKKQPFLIRMHGGRPFALAGLWEAWRGEGGKEIESFTILTTTANEVAGQVHDRMPVIIGPENYDTWLDPKQEDDEKLRSLLTPFAADQMEAFPVSPKVNSPKNDDAECIKQVRPKPAAKSRDSEGDLLF